MNNISLCTCFDTCPRTFIDQWNIGLYIPCVGEGAAGEGASEGVGECADEGVDECVGLRVRL